MKQFTTNYNKLFKQPKVVGISFYDKKKCKEKRKKDKKYGKVKYQEKFYENEIKKEKFSIHQKTKKKKQKKVLY